MVPTERPFDARPEATDEVITTGIDELLECRTCRMSWLNQTGEVRRRCPTCGHDGAVHRVQLDRYEPLPRIGAGPETLEELASELERKARLFRTCDERGWQLVTDHHREETIAHLVKRYPRRNR